MASSKSKKPVRWLQVRVLFGSGAAVQTGIGSSIVVVKPDEDPVVVAVRELRTALKVAGLLG